MTLYFIHTFATEDEKESICGYDYAQFKEVVNALKKSGKCFTTWSEKLY